VARPSAKHGKQKLLIINSLYNKVKSLLQCWVLR
jgi:hypothetical protein